VRFDKPFIERMGQLDPHNIYGFWTHRFCGKPYLSSWCLFISAEVWRSVGEFDEQLTPMWFEDADYCIRADHAGFGLNEMVREDWGFVHYAQDRVDERSAYQGKHQAAYDRNFAYLRGKHGL
jgi:GT2 family glycosyltransferase